MFKKMSVIVNNEEDYCKVRNIIDRYAKGHVCSEFIPDGYAIISFKCNIINFIRCKHDLNLAKQLWY